MRQQGITSGLAAATTRRDVQLLLERYGYDTVAASWTQIPPVQRAALSLVKTFDGCIIHDDDGPSDPAEPPGHAAPDVDPAAEHP